MSLRIRLDRVYDSPKHHKAFKKNKPNDLMIKVTGTETNDIIGFAQRTFNEIEEHDSEKTEASWHPEAVWRGGLLGVSLMDCGVFLQRPHMGMPNSVYTAEKDTDNILDLHSIAVHTSHRQRDASHILFH